MLESVFVHYLAESSIRNLSGSRITLIVSFSIWEGLADWTARIFLRAVTLVSMIL